MGYKEAPSQRSMSSGFHTLTRAVATGSARRNPKDKKSTIAAILPTYNEAGNIEKLLSQIKQAFEEMEVEPVVIIVDDNSPDKTADEAERVFQHQKWPDESYIVLRRDGKKGLGSAYRFATTFMMEQLSESKEIDYVLIMDSDLSHSPTDIPRLWDVAMPSSISVASRYTNGGTVGDWPWLRRMISGGANLIGKVALRLPVSDCTGSFRVYSANVWESVVPRSKCNGFGFQIEVLALASFMGYSFVEVPIKFNEREYGASKMSMVEIMRFIFVILRLLPYVIFGRLILRRNWNELYRSRNNTENDVTSHGYDSQDGDVNDYELSSSFLPSCHEQQEMFLISESEEDVHEADEYMADTSIQATFVPGKFDEMAGVQKRGKGKSRS